MSGTTPDRGEFTIRPAEETDLPQLLVLYGQLGSDQSRLTLANLEAAFQRMQRYPDLHIYVAETAGRMAGTYTLMIMDAAGHRCAPVAIVEDLVVAEERRGEGIGRMMMRHAMRRARQTGSYKLMLSSNLARGEAHGFYERLGFEKHGYSFVVRLSAGPEL